MLPVLVRTGAACRGRVARRAIARTGQPTATVHRVVVDGIEKARFVLTQASAAAALADAVPNPFAKRLAARGVFVAVASFIDVARAARNELSRTKGNDAELGVVKAELNALADRDWGPYRPLRDRIGAHRQPIGETEGAATWAAANALFAEIDRPLVGVLCDDMWTIFDRLAAVAHANAFAGHELSAATTARIAAAFPQGEPASVTTATGSFGETIANSLTAIQGGAIGERLRQVGDALDGWELYATVGDAVNQERWLHRAVMAGGIIETANIIELIFELPSGRAPDNRFAPLVELIPSTYAEGSDLQREHALLDPDDVTWVRQLRNTVAAHIDLRTPLRQLLRRLDETDGGRLSTLFLHVVNALSRVDSRHPITVLSPFVRLRGATLEDTNRVDPPEYDRGYAR